MTTQSTQITGEESLWGAVGAPSATELTYINESPLLVSELLAYQAAIDNGAAQPMGAINSVSGGNTLSYQTTPVGVGANGPILQIQLGSQIIGGSPQDFIGAVSYELGHFENYANDQQYYDSMTLNPNDQNDQIIAGVVGLQTEAESEANAYAVQQQILAATTTSTSSGFTISLPGNNSSGGALEANLNSAYEVAEANGVTDAAQDIGGLTQAILPSMDSFPAVGNNAGVKVNFFDYYAEDSVKLYNYFNPTSNVASGLQGPQPPSTSGVTFTDSSTGSVQSATVQFSSGNSETLNFTGSEVSSATYLDASGSIVSTISYVHNTDGSYSATFTDSSGAVVQTQSFSSDGSEVDTVTNVDTPVDVNVSGVTLTTNGDVIDVNGQDFDTTILNGDHVLNALAGDNFQLTGVGYDVNLTSAGGSTVTFEAGSGGTVAGTGNVIDVSGSGSNITTTGNTIALAGGTDATISGGGNTISADGSASGSTFTLEGTGTNADTLDLAGATDVTALLGNTTTAIDLGTNTALTVTSVDGGGTVTGTTGDNISITGSNVTLDATAGQYSLSGTGDTANVSNSTVSLASGNQATLTGSDNAVTASTNDNITLDGSGNSATVGTGSTIDVSGKSDSVSASGSTIDLASNSQATITGTDDSVAAATGDVIDLSNATITLTADSSVTIDGTNDTIVGAASDTITIDGNSDTVSGGTGDTINLLGNDSVDASGDTINQQLGSMTTSVVGSGDTIATTDGAGGDTVYLYGNNSVTDSHETVDQQLGSMTTTVDGSDDTLATTDGAANDTINLNGSAETLDITDDHVTFDAGSSAVVNGNSDTMAGSSDVTVTSDGSGDTLNGESIADGSTADLSSSGSFSTSGDGDGDGGDGDGGDGSVISEEVSAPGFSGTRSTIQQLLASDTSAIVQDVLGQGSTTQSSALQRGLDQAAQVAGETATSAGTEASVLEGAHWNSGTVTWSLDGVGGTMSAQEQDEVAQAFATWSAASGLKFEEISNASTADISLGFANLDTSATGLVGLTSFEESGGVIAPGATIELENPTADALTPGAGGQLTYAGTDATFYQTVLHEIGHALGLADNADAGSIMNYDLTSSNRTLDSTDLNEIQELYGSSNQTSLLIHAMAGFNPQPAGSIASLHDDPHHHPTLASHAS